MPEQSLTEQLEVGQERARQVEQGRTRREEREPTRLGVQPRLLELGQLLREQELVQPPLKALPELEPRL